MLTSWWGGISGNQLLWWSVRSPIWLLSFRRCLTGIPAWMERQILCIRLMSCGCCYDTESFCVEPDFSVALLKLLDRVRMGDPLVFGDVSRRSIASFRHYWRWAGSTLIPAFMNCRNLSLISTSSAARCRCSDLTGVATVVRNPGLLMTETKNWRKHSDEFRTFRTVWSSKVSKSFGTRLSTTFWLAVSISSTKLVSAFSTCTRMRRVQEVSHPYGAVQGRSRCLSVALPRQFDQPIRGKMRHISFNSLSVTELVVGHPFLRGHLAFFRYI